jgi:hypothetical protein
MLAQGIKSHEFYLVKDTCDNCGLSYNSLKAAAKQNNSHNGKMYECTNNLMFSCCGGSGAAKWDQSNQTWNCSDCGAPQSTDPSYIGNNKTPDNVPWWKQNEKKCECGSDKVGSGGHSTWCPKWVKY